MSSGLIQENLMNKVDFERTSTMAELTRTDESPIVEQARKPGIMRFFMLLLLGAAVLGGLWYFTNLTKKSQVSEIHKDREVAVTVAVATTSLVPVEIRSIGNVLPYSVVNIVPQ